MNQNTDELQRRNLRKGNFVWISKTAMDAILAGGGAPYTTLAVYIGLARIESDTPTQEKKDRMFVDPVAIGIRCGLGETCVKTHLKKLEALGIIRTVSGVGKKFKGSWGCNYYTLLEDTYEASQGSHKATSSLRTHKATSIKQSVSSPTEKETRSLKGKGASAGNPPAGAGVSDSAPKKLPTGVNTF